MCKSFCTAISNDAFASHTLCYIKSGVCGLTLSDYKLIFETVGDELLATQAIVQSIETGAACVDLKVLLAVFKALGQKVPPWLQGLG
jgi:hypothetical protein